MCVWSGGGAVERESGREKQTDRHTDTQTHTQTQRAKTCKYSRSGNAYFYKAL